MHRAKRKEREEFVAAIALHAGGNAERRAWFAQRMMYYGISYGRIQENTCNGYQTPAGDWDEQAALRDERKEKSIESKVNLLCQQFDCKVKFGGDPRGATIKIIVPDGYTNDWGREGICVPTS